MLHINRQVLFWAGNQGNHQNFKISLLYYKFGLISIGMKQEKKSKWPTQKGGPFWIFLLHLHENQSTFIG